MFVYSSLILAAVGFFLLILSIPLSLFFRDPDRKIGNGVISPADGKIVRVENRGKGYWFVSIFMNVHNVHVNRIPWDGSIVNQNYIKGGFVPAFDKDSDNNERLITTLKTSNGKWEITQIAGAVARRIVPYLSVGTQVTKGQRFGMIRYGSRVDVLFKLPRGMKIEVEVGQKVLAGTTNLAGPRKGQGKRMW